MQLSNLVRILAHKYWKKPLCATYWDLAAVAKEAKALLFHLDSSLRSHVRADLRRYFFCSAVNDHLPVANFH
jgi:hypothetical protein